MSYYPNTALGCLQSSINYRKELIKFNYGAHSECEDTDNEIAKVINKIVEFMEYALTVLDEESTSCRDEYSFENVNKKSYYDIVNTANKLDYLVKADSKYKFNNDDINVELEFYCGIDPKQPKYMVSAIMVDIHSEENAFNDVMEAEVNRVFAHIPEPIKKNW